MRFATLIFLNLTFCGSVLSDYYNANIKESNKDDNGSIDYSDDEESMYNQIEIDAGAPLDPDSDNESLIAMQFSKDPHVGKDKMEMILNGHLKLVDVIMAENNDTPMGYFCDFEFDQTSSNDPSLNPRYGDFYAKSVHCQEHIIALPLHVVAEACRKYDDTRGTTMGTREPDAFILHQPKSGSSLLSNMLTVARPGEIRVISEPAALGDILNCHGCQKKLKIRALQDTMYLLGRTTTTKQQLRGGGQLFVKISSHHTTGMPVLLDAFPKTKWLYIYRNANTIIQKLMDSKHGRRQCSKHRFHPDKPLQNYLSLNGVEDMDSIKNEEELCAAHLASQVTLVLNELTKEESNNGRLVTYEDLLSREDIDKIFEFLGVSPSNWEKVEEQRKVRANTGQGGEWIGESDFQVSQTVIDATSRFNVDNFKTQ